MIYYQESWKGHSYFRAVEPGYENSGIENSESDIQEYCWKINPGEIVVDVGAGTGIYTLPSLVSGAFVYAFEPDVVQTKLLQQSLLKNEFLDCEIIAIALSNKTGFEQAVHVGSQIIPNQVVALDDFIESRKIHGVKWIKIDTEGHELKVLVGGRTTIQRNKPNILVECHPFIIGLSDIVGQVVEFLSGMGYYIRLNRIHSSGAVHIFAEPILS